MATIPEFAALGKGLSCVLCLRILKLLLHGEELCVCEIVDVLQVPQYTCSRRLGVLSRAKMVVRRRDGNWAYYSLPPRPSKTVRLLLDILDQEVSDEVTQQDAVRLGEELAKRVNGRCVAKYS
jgi:ArsR family transcriptional regulator